MFSLFVKLGDDANYIIFQKSTNQAFPCAHVTFSWDLEIIFVFILLTYIILGLAVKCELICFYLPMPHFKEENSIFKFLSFFSF